MIRLRPCFATVASRDSRDRDAGGRSCRRGCVPFVSSTHRVIVKDRASTSRSLCQDSGRQCERRVAESVACMDSCMCGLWRTRPYYVTTSLARRANKTQAPGTPVSSRMGADSRSEGAPLRVNNREGAPLPRRLLASRTPRCYELLRSRLNPLHPPMRLTHPPLRTREVISMLSCVEFGRCTGRIAVGPGAPVGDPHRMQLAWEIAAVAHGR